MSADVKKVQTTQALVESLWQFWRRWRRASHPVIKGKITPEQYWLLMRLKKAGTLKVSELAQGLGITNSSATIATKRLEKLGLVSRVRQQSDERVVALSLTPEGVAALEQWSDEKREALTELISPLTAKEQEQLLRLLEKIL